MVMSKEILMLVLDFYPDWGHSPERFAEFIRVVMGCWRAHGERNGYDNLGLIGTEQELGEIFLRVFTSVDLRPYTGLEDLLEQTKGQFNLIAAIEKMKMESEAEDDFTELVESGTVSREVESILNEAFMEFESEEIIRKLSPFIDFEE